MNKIITKHKSEIASICEKNGVKNLYAFGSVLNDAKFDEQSSDVDFCVELKEMDVLEKGEAMLNLYLEFQKLFNRRIDLVTLKYLRNPIFKEAVESTKVLIYEG